MSEKTVEKAALAPAATAPAPVPGPNAGEPQKERVGSLMGDAWRDLRTRPLFLFSGLVILFLLVVSAAPGLFTSHSPFEDGFCSLDNSFVGPSAQHWFGYDMQGCDIYTRTIWATRNSVIVGVLTSVLTTLVGGLLGIIAGLRSGWLDSVLSRFTEIFFALPLMLGGLLIMSIFRTGNVVSVSLVMAGLGWPQVFRIMRGAVLANKNNDYVMAARALGADTLRIAFRHILPNAIAPVIVITTMNLGVFISAEAALSYLGIGIQSPNISWGLMISDAQDRFLTQPHALLFPAGALSITVLAFIMLGDAVRDALDPKLR